MNRLFRIQRQYLGCWFSSYTTNKGFRFLLCVIDVFSKYAWVVPLKDKKGVTITNAFQKIFKKSNKKPKTYGLTKQANFAITFFTKWLKDNDIEMY